MKRALLIAFAALLLLLAVGTAWLMTSESGLRWAWRTAASKLPAELSVGRVTGVLAGPITVSGIAYQDSALALESGRVHIDWNPWALLAGSLQISELKVESLRVTDFDSASNAAAGQAPAETIEISLPLALRLENAELRAIEINTADEVWRLQQLRTQLQLKQDRILIDGLELVSEFAEATLAGELTAADGYAHQLSFEWNTTPQSNLALSGSGNIEGNVSLTRLQQQLRGDLNIDQTVELEDLPGRLRWRSEIAIRDFDSRLLDETLPEIGGSLEANLEGDLNAYRAFGSLQAAVPRIGPVSADFELRSLEGERRFAGLRVEKLIARLLDGDLDAQGRIEWSPVLAWEGVVSLRGIDPASFDAEWPGSLDASLLTRGDFESEALSTTLEIRQLAGELRGYPVAAQGVGQLQDARLSIDSLEARSGETRLSVSGQANGDLDLAWSLHSNDLAEIYPGATGSLDARGVLRGSRQAPRIEAAIEGESLGIDSYRVGGIGGLIAIEPLRPERFDIDLAAENVRIEHSEFDRIAVKADPGRVILNLTSALGQAEFDFAGQFDHTAWRGRLLAATVETRDYSTWRLAKPAALELSADRIDLARSCLQSEVKGALCGEIKGSLQAWNLDLDIDDLPLRLLSNLLPPELDLEGRADARASLAYQHDQPLLGSIGIELQPGMARFRLASDETLQALYREVVLDLAPDAAGIGIDASLSMQNGDNLQLAGRLPGTFLLDLEQGFRQLQVRLRGKLSDLANVDRLVTEVEDLSGLLEFDLEVSGSPEHPIVAGNASLSAASAEIPPLDLSVSELEITAQAPNADHVGYRATARIVDGLVEAEGDTRLDPAAGWPTRIALQARNLAPAKYLKQLLPEEVDVEGRFDGGAELQFRFPGQLRGEIEIASERGKILYPLLEGELDDLEYYGARARLLLDEKGIAGESGLTAEEGISFEGRFELPGAALLDLDPEIQPILGNARLEFQQLKLLQLLSFDIEQPEGSLELDLETSGTLAKPRLAGHARLADAEVRIPRLGLQLTGITLDGHTVEGDRFDFVVEARSGEGHLHLDGSSILDAARGWKTRIDIGGEDFQIANIPEATVNVSPRLVMEVENRSIEISGDLLLPFARLEPRDITTARQVSNDAVVIGREEPDDPGWRLTTRINLILGEQVTFQGYGFEGRLAGRLLLEEKLGQPTSGTGEILIPEGRYRAYGQRLDIENGRFLFTGGPVNNPGLDVRATRTSGSVVSGLLIRGRLLQPQIELFSNPAMGQTDILSYLLFGRPLETASGEDGAVMAQAALALGIAGGDRLARSLRDNFGLDELRVEADDSGDQASLVMGRYLSSDVYVSYGVGLIESINSINLRYRISDRWQLEAESGTYHGADILYTIER